MRSTSSPRAVSMNTGTRLSTRSRFKNLKAIHARQHDIQNDQVVAALL